MRNLLYLLPLLLFLSSIGCEGDFRKRAIGDIDEIYVVIDTTQANAETRMAIEDIFAKPTVGVPGYEPYYNLRYVHFRTNDELEQLKERKNVIFVAPIDEQSNVGSFIRALLSDEVENRVRDDQSFAFPLEDNWVRDQWVLLLTSSSDSALASKIRSSEESLLSHKLNRELARWEVEVYSKLEQTNISDYLWDSYGWKVRVQHDYVMNVDTLNFISMRRYLPQNDRWMWAWWMEDVENIDFLDTNWIHATRDSLMEKYVRGERERSYITTDYRMTIETKEFEKDGMPAFESLGIWRMTADFMGGPFVNFTYYDPETQRLFMVEYGQFAPSVFKRRFVRQFRAMGRTFEVDRDFNMTEERLAATRD